MSSAERAAESGSLTEMLQSYDRDVLQEVPQTNDAQRLSGMMDYTGGMLGALTLMRARLKAGEKPEVLLQRLFAEARTIFDRLNPDLYRKKDGD